MVDVEVEAYFMSMEFWFAASGVTDDNRKYTTVMAQVPPSKLLELRPIIDALPNLNRYVYIKQRLIAHFAESQQRRLQRVLSEMPLGDRKPSQLFYDMAQTANGTLSDAVLIDLWATRLPSYAQAAVAASQGTTAERVRIADAVTESMSMRTINAVEPSMSTVPVTCAEPQWPQFEALKNEIATMLRGFRPDSRNRSRSRNNSRTRFQSRHRESSAENFEHCWYHRKFGVSARACRHPCTFRKPETSNSSR